MPETRLFFDESGVPIEFLVQARFEVSGQEYVAVSRKNVLESEMLFLRVELDNDGNEVLLPPLSGEREEVCRSYELLNRIYN